MDRAAQTVVETARSQVLRAVVARILPGTDGPGAARAAVAEGIERALAEPYYRGLRRGVETLLDQLQAQASARHALDFWACDSAQQDDLLSAVEHDPNPAMRFMFRIMVSLSVEGLLGDPAHGGNRDGLGWEFVGLRVDDVRAGLCRQGPER